MGGALAAFVAFAAAALIIMLLMFGLALAISLAQENLIETLRAGTRVIKRGGGVILILVGLWLIALAVWAAAFARIFPV